RVDADLRDPAGMKQIFRAARAGRLEADPGETQIDDLRQPVPVRDQEREKADLKGLLDQPRDDILIGAPSVEQEGERHVDDDQRARQEPDVAGDQAETGIDVATEQVEEAVDDAGIFHRISALPALLMRPARWAAAGPDCGSR